MSSLGHRPDHDLLGLIAAREPDALEVLYDRYISPVWKFALLSRGGDTQAADQAVYEAFTRLWKQPEADNTRPLAVRLFHFVRSSDGDIANPS